MSEFDMNLGFCMLGITLLFSLGLFPHFERTFYPKQQNYTVRFAAPAIFLCIAISCFAGFGFEMCVTLAILGSFLGIRDRRRKKMDTVLPA